MNISFKHEIHFLKQILLFVVCASLLSACNSGSSSLVANSASNQSILPRASTPPIELSTDDARFYANIRYDSDDALQNFDVFLPQSETPTPLVIYVHGGGFTGGDKSAVYDNANDYGLTTRSTTYSEQINRYLSENVAYATINYRLLADDDKVGVIKSLNDVKRALQFIRFHADELNIDKQRIVLHGLSAGAGASLWVAMQDELADANSVDPIERESTRVLAVVAQETQATYDLVSWLKGGVFSSYFGVIGNVFTPQLLDAILFAQPSFSSRITSFYGIETPQQVFDESVEAYRNEVDFLNYISADDPEIWVANEKEPVQLPVNETLFFHHAYHAQLIQTTVDQKGASGVFYMPMLDIVDSSNESLPDFVLRKLFE